MVDRLPEGPVELALDVAAAEAEIAQRPRVQTREIEALGPVPQPAGDPGGIRSQPIPGAVRARLGEP